MAFLPLKSLFTDQLVLYTCLLDVQATRTSMLVDRIYYIRNKVEQSRINGDSIGNNFRKTGRKEEGPRTTAGHYAIESYKCHRRLIGHVLLVVINST